MERAYYTATFATFLVTEENEILGELARHHGHALEERQRNAWLEEIVNLKNALKAFGSGQIFFEFSIPRMGRRADVVLLLRGVVIVIEYKVGATAYNAADIEQAEDYALDLKNFHSGSHRLPIVPILVSTQAPDRSFDLVWNNDQVAEPVLANADSLRTTLDDLVAVARQPIVTGEWLSAQYKPTPTIVEAAKALYNNHSVEEISRSDSGAINLSRTAEAISNAIEHAKVNGRKIICFVTGVPGSGKTLAGLNLATERSRIDQTEHAVFLSGNGPLVTVLREALARDLVEKGAKSGETIRKTDARRKAETFIQNIHHFRDEALRSDEAPIERVVVFDESQRAWTREEQTRFMKEKRGMETFDMSEPEFLLSVMDRHETWCAVICLVGSGQEINKGEAGIAGWLRARAGHIKDWDVVCPDRNILAREQGNENFDNLLSTVTAKTDSALHLEVCIRSFRSESVAAFVRAVIDGDSDRASQIHGSLEHYPIVITRTLDRAREWLRVQARGSERYGFVASSNALRLRPVGIFVKSKIDIAGWFLNPKEDVRSSFALEEVASEFEVQGLELDWVGVCWDANLRYSTNQWALHRFSGTKWNQVQNSDRQMYLHNSYRVLLTRARQGMVILVPHGSDDDPTRKVDYYEGTFKFLKSCGIAEI